MPALPSFPPASPDDVLDYDFPFLADLLAGETLLTASVLAMPPGLVVIGVTPASPTPVARLTGGVSGTRYVLFCTAATSFGRVLIAEAVLVIGALGLDDPNLTTPAPAGEVP